MLKEEIFQRTRRVKTQIWILLINVQPIQFQSLCMKDLSTTKKKQYNNKNIMEFSSKPRKFCLFLAMLVSTVQSLPSASPVQTSSSKKSSNQCGVRSWGAPLNNATQLSNFDEDHFRAYPDSFPWVVQLGLSSPQINSDRWSNWEICFWQLSMYYLYVHCK